LWALAELIEYVADVLDLVSVLRSESLTKALEAFTCVRVSLYDIVELGIDG